MSSVVSTHLQQIADTAKAVAPTTTTQPWGSGFRVIGRYKTVAGLRDRGQMRDMGLFDVESQPVGEGDQGVSQLHLQREISVSVVAVYLPGGVSYLELLKVMAEDGDKVLGALTNQDNWSAGVIVQDCEYTIDQPDDENSKATVTWTVTVRYMPDYDA